MKSGVLMADMAIDPEMLSNLNDFEVNLKLRHIPVAERKSSPVQPGPFGHRPPEAQTRRRYGWRADYNEKEYKKPHYNEQGHASVRVDSVEARIITGL